MGGKGQILFWATLVRGQVAKAAEQTHQGTRPLSKDMEKLLKDTTRSVQAPRGLL